ncbi:MAG: DUF1801 domain-containing protein [Chloroflexota bacterium]
MAADRPANFVERIRAVDTGSQIDAYLDGISGWQRDVATRLRELIHEADSEVAEAWKWGTPVFVRGGANICALGVFSDHVKVNFFKGASLPDPGGLFNAGMEAKASRAIDLHEGDSVDEVAFRALVREAADA